VFGNPFLVSEHGHDRAVALHRAWITGRPIEQSIPPATKKELSQRREEVLRALPRRLRGKNLACWYPLPNAGEANNCHAAILLALVNG
jgi:Domain of unknown function (DUF4326)